MKKLKLIFASILLVSVFACDKDDAPFNRTYDEATDQTGLGFTQTSTSAVVPVDGSITVTLAVQATNRSSSARSFNVSVDTENSVGDSSNYTVGGITIPADEYNGVLEVTLNDNTLVDLEAYSLILNLEVPDGVAVVGSSSATINYNRYLICNDVTLTLNEDFYSDERSWEVVDSAGNVVESGGPYPQVSGGSTVVENFFLADGCYTFTIFDSYGDGQFDGNITGGYSLDCSIINLASGTGNWGASDSTDFCINP